MKVRINEDVTIYGEFEMKYTLKVLEDSMLGE